MNRYLLGAIIWAIIILVLTLTPGEHVPQVGLFSYDKLGHSVVFGVLSFLISYGLLKAGKLTIASKKNIIISVTFTVVYGLLLEIIQHFIPGRAMDYVDAIANTVGAICGIGGYYLINKIRA